MRAPWRSNFLAHVSKMSSPEFVLCSLHISGDQDAPTPYVPRARFCIFRGMWAELPENKHNQAPHNDRIFESDLLTLTSDVRMEKIPEIFSSSPGHGGVKQSQGSGGGGSVEAVFWAKEVQMQWRFRGEAYVIGQDIEGAGEESSGTRTVKSQVGTRMRLVQEHGKENWSWARELTAHFGNLSPAMRGSFRNPAPGSPTSAPTSDPSLGLGQKVDDLGDETARKNFRVIVIKVDEVEQIDLTDPERGRRWKYTYLGGSDGQDGGITGGWRTEELWP